MWDFDIVHVPGKKNIVADALSRRPEAGDWEPPDEPEEDVEGFIDIALGALSLDIPINDRIMYSPTVADILFDL